MPEAHTGRERISHQMSEKFTPDAREVDSSRARSSHRTRENSTLDVRDGLLRGHSDAQPVLHVGGVVGTAALLYTLVRLLVEASALGTGTCARLDHHQVLSELLRHGAVEDEVDGVVDERDHVQRVGYQHVHVEEEVPGHGGHDDGHDLRDLRDDVHDDDDEQHRRRALVPRRATPLRVLATLVGVGEKPLPSGGTLVQLLQKKADEDGDESAGHQFSHKGDEPEGGHGQVAGALRADGWLVQFVQCAVPSLHLSTREEREECICFITLVWRFRFPSVFVCASVSLSACLLIPCLLCLHSLSLSLSPSLSLSL